MVKKVHPKVVLEETTVMPPLRTLEVAPMRGSE